MGKKLLLVPVAVVLLVAVACGAEPSSSPATTVAATTTSGAGASTTAAVGTTAKAAKVSANDASEDELKAALEAAGVTNASKWAHEIEEYRPYDRGDPSLTKLKQELAKYNPGKETLDKIVSVLEP